MTPENTNINASTGEVIPSPEKSSLMFTGATYDFFKKSAQLILPAAGAFYFALAAIWGLPAADQVVGTIAALNVFLGVLVTLSARNYNNSNARFDGSIDVTQGEDSKLFSLNLDTHPDALENKDEVTFKVNK